MFSELIYTRCRQGIDILKSGRPLSSDGFKVYSCTASLLEDNNTDMQFLFNSAQGKQPYNDPTFMDDAYLYFVPDKGANFMVDFHPVPYDVNATGDYSHRAGNFINQILVGDFSGFYPFELFGDEAVWNAKTRGEAFYYENASAALPARKDVNDPVGQIDFEDIASFISDGRREALMTAVSFLITQFELPPENRKFLVIRDETSKHIELWIAAIEHAFSPRIAASISFATRLDKFATANRYTVNQLGLFQTQINLQDPNQKQRYRAMIVGVDDRDKANVAAVRPLPNSPFVLLDGKEKRMTVEADTSNRYYRLIGSFDEAHQIFCREFLQMLEIREPSADIYRLYDIYVALENSPSLPNAESVAKMLSVIGKYKAIPSSRLKNLYARITAELPRFLQEHLQSALQIIKWLKSISLVIGDNNAAQQLTGIVCKVFSEQVYRKSDAEGTFSFWESIKQSEFASGVASYFVSSSTLKEYGTYIQQFKKVDKTTFVLIYLECASVSNVSTQDIKSIVDYGLKSCASDNDAISARKILKTLSLNRMLNAQDMLLSIAKEAGEGYKEFVVRLLIESDETIIATDNSMMTFFKKLSAEGLERLFASILQYRIHSLSKPADIEQFAKMVKKIQPMSSRDLADVFESLDRKILLTDKGSMNAAVTLQHEKPKEAICVKSAHLYVLDVLNDRRKRPELLHIFDELVGQGFPSINDAGYISTLTDRLFKAQIDQKELSYIVQLFARVPAYIAELVGAVLGMTTAKRNDEWNTLLIVASKTRDRATNDAIISECAKLKQGEKALTQLSDMLGSRETRDYFVKAAEKSREIMRSQKPQSGFGKLFGLFSKDDDPKHGKK